MVCFIKESKRCKGKVNIVDPDQTAPSGSHCLPRPVCLIRHLLLGLIVCPDLSVWSDCSFWVSLFAQTCLSDQTAPSGSHCLPRPVCLIRLLLLGLTVCPDLSVWSDCSFWVSLFAQTCLSDQTAPSGSKCLPRPVCLIRLLLLGLIVCPELSVSILRTIWYMKNELHHDKVCLWNMSHLMTKPTKWHVRPAKTQTSLGIHPVLSESLLSAWRKLGSLATHWADREDSDQTGQMSRLVWVFTGHKDILLVLSWGGSYANNKRKADQQRSDQHLCYLLPWWYNTYICYIWNFKTLAGFWSFRPVQVATLRGQVFSLYDSNILTQDRTERSTLRTDR